MKKMLSVLLAAATALSVCGGLAACTSEDQNAIRIWGPEELRSFYETKISEFKASNADYANITFKYEAKEEGNVLETLQNDPEAGADLFFFASDHLGSMIANNYLSPLTDSYKTSVIARDNETNVTAATKNGNVYAFPATNDNGYFLVYNSDLLTAEQAGKLDSILEVAERENKSFMYRYETGYYGATFFFGEGVIGTFDGAGSDFSCYNSTAAENAAKAMIKYIKSGTCDDGETPKIINLGDNGATVNGIKSGTLVAGVCGAWEAPVAADGDNLVCTKLPTFTATDGTQKQMGGFFGGKYCGVNSRTTNAKVAFALADFFTNESTQYARFQFNGTGPSNKVVAAKEDVLSNGALKGLAEQVAAGGVVQGDVPSTWWSGIETYIADIKNEKVTTDNLKLADLVTALTPEQA